jgi:transcription antitermination factor NusA-like protein/GTP-binding protein EngB required for normal cell division
MIDLHKLLLANTDSELKKAASVAKKEYKVVSSLHDDIFSSFSTFDIRMTQMEKKLLTIQDSHQELADSLRTILDSRRQGIKQCWDEWNRLFQQREKDLKYFSVMLFGRTMCGKSTTLEALAGGDGSKIGPGIPDFTHEVDSVAAGLLRIVDTPGIEGFCKEIASKAEAYMDRADVVTFIIGDDTIEPVLLKKIISIIKTKKPFIILLNINVGKIERFIRNPKSVFRNDEIDGHKRRIKGFLKAAATNKEIFVDVDSIPIIPYCAEAANIAINNDSYDTKTRKSLFENSKITDFTKKVEEIILERAISTRSLAAYESFMINQQEIGDGLEIELSTVNRQLVTLEKSISGATDLFENLYDYGTKSVQELKEHFYILETTLDAYIEKVFNGDYDDPQKEFNKFLNLEHVSTQAEAIQNQYKERISRKVADFQSNTMFDFNLVAAMSLGQFDVDVKLDHGSIGRANMKKIVGKYGKMVGAPAGGFALAWAVANFWNPSGWVAGAVVVGVVVGSVAGGVIHWGAKKLQNSGKKDIIKAKQELKHKLKASLNKICENDVMNPLNKWVKDITDNARKYVDDSLLLIHQEIGEFINTGQEFLADLNRVRVTAATSSIKALLPLFVPRLHLKRIKVERAARRVGYKTKILVKGFENDTVISHLFGKHNNNIRKLSSVLNNENITIISYDNKEALSATTIVEALHPAELENAEVCISSDSASSIPEVNIYNIDADQLQKASGTNNWNLRLAETVLQCRILLHERKKK